MQLIQSLKKPNFLSEFYKINDFISCDELLDETYCKSSSFVLSISVYETLQAKTEVVTIRNFKIIRVPHCVSF